MEEVGDIVARVNEEDIKAVAGLSTEIRARARGEEISLRGEGEGESEGAPTSEDVLSLLLSRRVAGATATATGRRLKSGWADAVSWLPMADTKTRRRLRQCVTTIWKL